MKVELTVFLVQMLAKFRLKKVEQRGIKIVSQYKITNIMTNVRVFGNQLLTKWENLLLNLQEFIKK